MNFFQGLISLQRTFYCSPTKSSVILEMFWIESLNVNHEFQDLNRQPGYVGYQELYTPVSFYISEYCSHNFEISPQEMFPLSNN